MANRYSTPAQAQFMNTYVPIPFDNILQAGLSRQQQYNTGQAVVDNAQTQAEALKYIPGSKDQDFITNDVIRTVKEVVDEFGSQDFSDPVIMRAVNKRLQSIDRNRVNRTQQSAEAHSQYLQDVRKLGLAGKGAEYLNKFDPSNFSSEFDVFNQTPEARLDYKAAAEGYFNNMDEKYLGTTDVDKKAGIKGLLHGIPKSELLSRAGEITEDYMNSAEGQQHIKQFQHNGVPEEEIPSMIQNYIRNIALEKSKTRVTSTYADPNFKGGEDNKGVTASSYVPGIGVTQAGVGAKRRQLNKNIKGVEDYSDFTVNYVTDSGKEVSGYRKLAGKIDKALLGTLKPLQMFFGKDVIDRMNENSTKERVFKDDISKINFESLLVKAADYTQTPINDLIDKPIKEQDAVINSYLKDFQTEAKFPDTKEITNTDKVKWLNNVVLGEDTKGNKLAKLRTWYDPETPTGTAIDYTEVSKEYPRDEYNYTISHELSPYNPIMPSAYMVDIEDKTGNTVKTMYMSGPERNEGDNYLETSATQNQAKFTLYNQMFSEPTGRVLFTDSYKGEPITLEGMALNKGKVMLNVRDKNNEIIGSINIDNPGSTELSTTDAVIQNLQTILSDIK